ncbi:hypothetical protein [Sulfobacillus thermosulfidooxidans]|uniref:hypothetical protein n=1 Tax=Sulfobacillus thermosulfidooxidans TaxID=28034 RepID=UPI0006B41886|nr:hypothetical protein [Sulfobacillus thermosulfidooxidans]
MILINQYRDTREDDEPFILSIFQIDASHYLVRTQYLHGSDRPDDVIFTSLEDARNEQCYRWHQLTDCHTFCPFFDHDNEPDGPFGGAFASDQDYWYWRERWIDRRP